MSLEKLIYSNGKEEKQRLSEPLVSSSDRSSSHQSFHERSNEEEEEKIFEELPTSTIVSVTRSDSSDFNPLLLSYTIQLQYKQKAPQVIYLHLQLKKRAIIEEFHEKQEQAKDWLRTLRIGDQTTVMHEGDDLDDETVHSHHEENTKKTNVPSRAALPIIFPALGKQQSVLDTAKVAMQGYLNHFLGNMDIVNSREVSSGAQSMKLKTRSSNKVRDWVAAINKAVIQPPEGWCLGLTEDGSQAQWFVTGRLHLKLLPKQLRKAKSEFCSCEHLLMHSLCCIIFITDWWLCPELYLRRSFSVCDSSRLDVLLKQKLSKGFSITLQIYILLYKEVPLALKINRMYSKQKLLKIHENVRVLRYHDHISTGVYLWYESEPNSWVDTMRDELDRCKYPRMPWHDVHCALWALLAHHTVIPHYLGRRNTEIMSESTNTENNHRDTTFQGSLASPASIQDIPLLFPREANGLVAEYENQNLNSSGEIPNPKDQLSSHNPTLSVFSLNSKDKPPASDSMDLQINMCSNEQSGRQCSDAWWKGQEREDQVIPADEAGQVGPRASCRCQVIRSVGQWSAGTSQTEESIHNAYCSLIDKAEHYVYIEVMTINSLLNSNILRAYRVSKCFRVIIVMPLLPGFQGGLDDGDAASVRAIMHWQYRTICRGKNSILQNLYGVLGPRTRDYISFYSLRGHGRLCDGGPLVTNQVYVHSKVLLIDDHTAMIGSANIDGRSLLGSRDSEICIVIEDKEFVNSYTKGKPWKAGKLTSSLRISLWAEHLGIRDGEVNQSITCPVADATYKDIWMATAKANTSIFQDVFVCVPNDNVHSRSAIRQSIAYWKDKLGYTTIDLGVAPSKLEAFHKGDVTDPMKILESIRGHLVSFPLEFMCQEEDLRPMIIESEFYVSPEVFH
ncbi:hypothetical protein MKX01_021729 [Papaver californicum]|nr:hypothetical protein MKX01_021729 [Papaver californicum]